MSASVKVPKLPKCDFCQDETLAQYDARTTLGSWANMCEAHWKRFRMYLELGTGKGQRLLLKEEAKP